MTDHEAGDAALRDAQYIRAAYGDLSGTATYAVFPDAIGPYDHRVAALVKYVRAQEWSGYSYWCDETVWDACPECHKERGQGHADGCELRAALRAFDDKPAQPDV